MKTNEARDYLIQIVEDAAAELGSKANLARHFNVQPPAVSQWLKRGKFPGKLVAPMAQILKGKHNLARIKEALFVVRFEEEH